LYVCVNHADRDTPLTAFAVSVMELSEKSSSTSSPSLHSISTKATEDTLINLETTQEIEDQYVLVTGGLGFIGSHTAVELLKAGYNVIIVDDLSNSFRTVFSRILTIVGKYFNDRRTKCPKAILHQVNYRDQNAMRAVLNLHNAPYQRDKQQTSNVIGVIHFAAHKSVEESIRQPLRYYRNNINGLVDFLTLLEEFDIKTFIFSSSASVYGSLADGSQLLREEHCVHEREVFQEADGTERHTEPGYVGITSPYGRTKFWGEAILSDLVRADPAWNILALRYFNPIGCDASGLLGEDPKGVPSNLVPVVVKVMTGQYPELSIYGNDWNTPDGTAVRDFIHVTDLARGHTAALSAARAGRIQGGFRTLNLGTGTGYSVMQVVTAMEEVTRQPIPRKIVGRRAGDVQSSVAAVDRARGELGWTTQESLTDACRDIWNYLKLSEI
jgi:UDP-glucose 4-epimerase